MKPVPPRPCLHCGKHLVLRPGETKRSWWRRSCCGQECSQALAAARRGHVHESDDWARETRPWPEGMRFDSLNFAQDVRPIGATRIEAGSGQGSSMATCGEW